MAKLSQNPLAQVFLCQEGRYVELLVHKIERNNIFGSNRTTFYIEGSIDEKDLLDADNTIEGAAINAGGIPPEIYLQCPDCAHITAEGHECTPFPSEIST